MKRFQASFILLGIILILVFAGVSCDKDDWQDHLTDPGLGGEIEEEEGNSWIGTWNFISWWATDESGAIVEGPEEWEPGEVGGFTLNEDGTYSFDGLEFTAEGNYTVSDNVLTFETEDEWWGQGWKLSFNEDGNLLIGSGNWPTGEGEGYLLKKGEGEALTIVNAWGIIAWTEIDAEGNITGQENVGTLTGEFEEADYVWFENDNSFAWKWIAEGEEESGVGTYELVAADTVGITTTEESHWGGEDPAVIKKWHYVLMPGDTVKLHITNPEMGWLFIPMDMLPEGSRTDKPAGLN